MTATPPLQLPLGRERAVRFLPWLIGFMTFLATLSLAAALLVNALAERWDQGLEGRLTIQVPRSEPPDPVEDEQRLDDVLKVLTETRGLREAEVLDDSGMASILAPWIDDPTLVAELRFPVLIAVTLDSGELSDDVLQELSQRLEGIAPGTYVDTHQRWLVGPIRLADSIELVAAVVLLMVMASAVLAVIFVTQTSLTIHRSVIELLHLMGARDRYIAVQFQNYSLRAALFGALAGLLGAGLTITAISYAVVAADQSFAQPFEVGLSAWLPVSALPLAFAAVAAVTARFTVLRHLARL